MVSEFESAQDNADSTTTLSAAIKGLSLENAIIKETLILSDTHTGNAKSDSIPVLSTLRSANVLTSPNVGKSINRRASTPALNKKSSMSSIHKRDSPSTPKRVLSRRSSGLLQHSPVSIASPNLPTQIEDREGLTESTVAAQWFKKDLAQHEAQNLQTETVVILHDSCYGHRYSRPRTNKATLSTIVERPERVQASVVGVSAAYVRLGEKHMGGSEAPHPKREPLVAVPFTIQKSTRFIDLGSPAITNVHGTKWMEELKEMCLSAETKLATTGRELTRSSGNSSDKLPKVRLHEGDLYLCSESLNAFQGALGGVCDGVDVVFGSREIKRAFVCVRPPGHHCSSDYPSGFCWLNNVHAGIQHAAQTHGLTHAAIIDFDLHHGDGSQTITWQHNARAARLNKNAPSSKKVPIGYFSLHDINSYPCEEGDEAKVQSASLCVENAHGQTVWNVHLQPWRTLEEFWELYRTKYSIILDKAKAFLRTHTERLSNSKGQTPRSAIFISAGFDASEWETADMQRHKINVPTDFYARFTSDVVLLANEAGLAVNGRVVSVLEGGYSDRALASGVFSHLSGMCRNSERNKNTKEALVDESNTSGTKADSYLRKFPANSPYNSDWWSKACLDELDEKIGSVNKANVKPRNPSHPTFFAQTQSSAAKVIDPSKITRSISISKLPSPSRPSSPPPPDVTWATATYELSKLLIPTDRQIGSCLPEELVDLRSKKEKSTSVKKLTDFQARSMQLRGKKPPKESEEPAALQTKLKSVSRTTRRRTIAELQTTLEGSPMPPLPAVSKPRRLSIASSITSTDGNERKRSSNMPSVPALKVAVPSANTRDLNLKKTRAPSQRRAGSSKSASGSDKTPNSKTTSTRAAKLKSSTNSAAGQPQVRSTSSSNEEVDGLATMMKKITIRVPAGPKYAELQRQVASAGVNITSDPSITENTTFIAANGAPPSHTVVSNNTYKFDNNLQYKREMRNDIDSDREIEREFSTSSPHKEYKNITLESVDSMESNRDDTGISGASDYDQITQPTTNIPTDPQEPAVTTSSPIRSPTGPQTPTPPQPESTSMHFIPYEPENGSTRTYEANAEQQQQQQQSALPLQWLPPNTSTPAPAPATAPDAFVQKKSASPQKLSKQGLPRFTATGFVPFGGIDSDGGGGGGGSKGSGGRVGNKKKSEIVVASGSNGTRSNEGKVKKKDRVA